jgi:hypothetical protein
MERKPQNPAAGSEYQHEVEGKSRPHAASQADPDGLLDEVVRRTMWDRDALEQLDERERHVLTDVARRLAAARADQETVAVELTRALLAVRYPLLAQDATHLEEVAREVAEELLDAPSSAERLNALWAQLQEGLE